MFKHQIYFQHGLLKLWAHYSIVATNILSLTRQGGRGAVIFSTNVLSLTRKGIYREVGKGGKDGKDGKAGKAVRMVGTERSYLFK